MQSLEAEYLVQTKLIELGKEENVTMVAFRGIKTYGCIGQFLEGFGMKFSKLRYTIIIIKSLLNIHFFRMFYYTHRTEMKTVFQSI